MSVLSVFQGAVNKICYFFFVLLLLKVREKVQYTIMWHCL